MSTQFERITYQVVPMAMSRFLLILLLILSRSLTMKSQHFDWAVAGSGMFCGFEYGATLATGELLSGMNYTVPSYNPLGNEPMMYSSDGDSINCSWFRNQFLVFIINKEGKITQTIQSSQFASGAHLLGIVPKKNNHFILVYEANNVSGLIKTIDQHGLPYKCEPESAYEEQHYNEQYPCYDGRDTRTGDAFVFTEFDRTGKLLSSTAVFGIDYNLWFEVQPTPDNGLVLAYYESVSVVKGNQHRYYDGSHVVLKMDEQYKPLWTHRTHYDQESTSGVFIPAMRIAVDDIGDIYTTGNVHVSMKPDGSERHYTKVMTIENNVKLDYESYIAKINANGKLGWVRYTGSPTILEDVVVDDKNVYFCGRLRNADKLADSPIDTAGNKLAFIASMTKAGAMRWTKSFRASTLKTLDADGNGHVQAIVDARLSDPIKTLVIGNDTLKNCYSDLIVVSFKTTGDIIWTKSSNVPMSNNSDNPPILIHDHCGNVYVMGEMWFVLPANLALFDAALLHGLGYGGAPFAVKIRTTLSAESESINEEVVAQFSHEVILPEVNIEKEHQNPESTDNELVENCIPIPEPWKLSVSPNPTSGYVSANCFLSYNDYDVKLELWDAQGNFITTFYQADRKDAGSFGVNFDITSQAPGVYVLVLHGRNSAVSARIVKLVI